MIDYQIRVVSDSVSVIELSGKLNEMTRSYFFDCVSDTLAGTCQQIVVDCGGLGMLGSAGLAALMLARKQARKKGGKIFLTHVDSNLATVLEQTNLNTLFAIYPSTDQLLEQLMKGELANA